MKASKVFSVFICIRMPDTCISTAMHVAHFYMPGLGLGLVGPPPVNETTGVAVYISRA